MGGLVAKINDKHLPCDSMEHRLDGHDKRLDHHDKRISGLERAGWLVMGILIAFLPKMPELLQLLAHN
jgi:hypothetical protein